MNPKNNNHCKYRGDLYDVCHARLGSCRRSCISWMKILILGLIIVLAATILFACIKC